MIRIPIPFTMQDEDDGPTTTHHPRRLRVRRRRLVHAMLDGVFERGNNFFNVRWQFDSALDEWPDRDWR